MEIPNICNDTSNSIFIKLWHKSHANKQRKEKNPDEEISYVTNIGNKKKELKVDARKALIASLILLALSASLSLKNSKTSIQEPQIQWADRRNGSDTEAIAKMTYIIVPEKEVTEEYIKDWYKKVQALDSDYDVIIYEETKNDNPSKGVYAITDMVLKDVDLIKENDGSYSYTGVEEGKTVDINK